MNQPLGQRGMNRPRKSAWGRTCCLRPASLLGSSGRRRAPRTGIRLVPDAQRMENLRSPRGRPARPGKVTGPKADATLHLDCTMPQQTVCESRGPTDPQIPWPLGRERADQSSGRLASLLYRQFPECGAPPRDEATPMGTGQLALTPARSGLRAWPWLRSGKLLRRDTAVTRPG